jgi:putative ABC transport system permease protein
VARAWAAYLRPLYPVVVDTLDDIKVQAMTVFDRTFRVTVVLTWLSGGVAFCGLAGSLLSLALARRRDYGLLAAVGMTGRQLAAWVLAQGLLIAWASALVAAVAGTVLAYVLAYVIQYRSFGWSIPTHAHPRFWAENVAMATVAAVAAAVYPIVRLRATPPAADLRVE